MQANLLSKTFLFFLSILLWTSSLDAQKMLQLDRFGKKKASYIKVGQEIEFRLKGDDYFYVLPVRDLDAEKNLIIFDTGEINIDDIEEIKLKKNAPMMRALRAKLITFGLSWALYTGIGAAAGGPAFTLATIFVSGTAFIAGGIFSFFLFKRKMKLGKKRNLRIIDLSPPGA